MERRKAGRQEKERKEEKRKEGRKIERKGCYCHVIAATPFFPCLFRAFPFHSFSSIPCRSVPYFLSGLDFLYFHSFPSVASFTASTGRLPCTGAFPCLSIPFLTSCSFNLPSFLPFFLPSFLFPACLPSFHVCFFAFFLPCLSMPFLTSVLSICLPSFFLPSFLLLCLPSFVPPFLDILPYYPSLISFLDILPY